MIIRYLIRRILLHNTDEITVYTGLYLQSPNETDYIKLLPLIRAALPRNMQQVTLNGMRPKQHEQRDLRNDNIDGYTIRRNVLRLHPIVYEYTIFNQRTFVETSCLHSIFRL